MTSLPEHPFLLSQIASLGLTRAGVRSALDEGAVRRVLHGVYCRADLEDTLELRARAAALVLSKDQVLCDRSAAWLWGVACLEYAEQEFLPALEVVSIGGADRRRREGLLGGKRDLVDDEVCEIEGIRVTTPARTACDLACLRGRHSALAVYDSFRRQHGLTVADYQRTLARFHGRRGVKQARELAAYAVDDAESPGESWTRMSIIDEGLPAPEPQVWVLVSGLGWVRLDLAYKHLRVAVEYDGEEHHTRDEDRAHDERRREALRGDGWIVIVVRKSDLTGVARQRWLDELRAALADRIPTYERRYSRGEFWGRGA